GVICKTGRFVPVVDERERIMTPFVKKDGSLKAATWDEAIDAVAAKLKPLAGKGDEGIAAISSSKLPIEALFTFKQLFRDQLKANLVTSLDEGEYTRA